MENQGNKLVKNVKIRWVSILELTKKVMNEYCIIMVKMALDCANNNFANVKLQVPM